MIYKKMKDKIYVRMDPEDELIGTVLAVCKKEGIASAIYQGIGGCKEITRLGYSRKTDAYEEQTIRGNLDMGSVLGNITTDTYGKLCHHTHTVFSCVDERDEVKVYAGHTLRAVVSYAAEIVIQPVEEGMISRVVDPENGAQIWKF